MIEISNIMKSFDGKPILHGVDGVFDKGKTNLIGTGKTVLMKCIVGLVDPDDGDVMYDGRDFTHANRQEKINIRREIGMLFQGGALFDSKNVEENVGFPLDQLTRMPKAEKIDRINFVLEKVGLPGVNKKMPSELSGGMKKRVGIARAIVNNSHYLFCDEPNSGLDPQTAIRIDNLIKEITHELNITTIVVTHDMNSVMEIGEYVMFMFQGRKLWEGSNSNILGAEVKELTDFVYANKLMESVKQAG